MNKKECAFCNFKDREVLVYEDKLCYAIISKNPINKYHILVVPINHYQDFVELPNKLVSHIILVAKRISKAVRRACKPDAITHTFDDDISKSGYNLVAHYKFHIIPRFKKDMHLIDWSTLRMNNLSSETRSKFAKDIKKYLN